MGPPFCPGQLPLLATPLAAGADLVWGVKGVATLPNDSEQPTQLCTWLTTVRASLVPWL